MGQPTLPNTITMLVVDDERVARRVAFRTLSEEGFRVFEADGGEEALQILNDADGRVDLVMIDVVMPDADGVMLAALILGRWPKQRILFMSAHPAEVLAQHGLHHLTVVFLAKPYTRSEILAKVKEALAPPKQASTETRQRAE